MEKDKLRLCPPRLNRPYTQFGFKVHELFILAALFIVGVKDAAMLALAAAAFIAILFFRYNGGENLASQFRRLYRYLSTPQALITIDTEDKEMEK